MGQHKKYSDELKERAVRLVLESGSPVSEIARDLNIRYEALRGWVRQARIDAGSDSAASLTSSERDRLRFLERENKKLVRTIEVLKAASIFFAKEMDQTQRR